MHINPLLNLSKIQTDRQSFPESSKEKTNDTPSTTANVGLRSKFNDHMLSFKARVDKGLERFFDTNKDRMPATVRRYVNSIDDKSRLSPIEAQQRAFYKLNDAESVQDIKKFFPDEELFTDLKNPSQSKATRGLLNSVKENKELFDLYDIDALKDKKNLTVYLVQKVFLEAKTIDEINADLENDLNEDFKEDFKLKNKDSKYVYSSTLRSLGIKTPSFEYQQSLRYTRDGYADEVGDKISQGQRAFWDSLSDEDRTARAKKSVEKFEIWWNSFTTNQKLDMIADQLSELDMLKNFKKVQRAEQKNNPKPEDTETSENTSTQRKHTKTGSEKLSKDELFIKWASNNLKLFEANLSEAQKDTLHLKRMQRLSARWASMSPVEKTDYISKMKAGSEPLRYTMIDAWNHSTDLIKDLSLHLRANQIFKPADLLYSTQEFSEFQSKVMTQFWEEHPDYAVTLGNKIRESQQKVQTSIQRGTFEELKKQIMRDKNQRVKEMEKFKTELKNPPASTTNNLQPEYIQEFKSAYLKAIGQRLHNIPGEYMKEYFESVKDLPKEYIISWTKQLKGEHLTYEDESNLHKLMQSDSEKSAYAANRALEAALSNVLYEYTKNPEVYTLSFSDVKAAIYKLEIGQNPIEFHSTRLGKDFILPVQKKVNINKKHIENLYHEYRQPVNEAEISDIIRYYFTVEGSKENKNDPEFIKQVELAQRKLENYIKKYNKSASIIFSDKSTFSPHIKDAFYRKFIANMPKDIMDGPIKPLIKSLDDFKYEEKLKTAKFMFGKKFDFVPKNFMDSYFREISKELRENKTQMSVDDFISVVCQKRKVSSDHGKVIFFDKQGLSMENKLNSLAMEQALADVLYEATDNENIYSMGLETLCDNLEVFVLAKKFPTSEKRCPATQENEEMTIVCKKKPNLFKIQKLYNEYQNQIIEWTTEIAQNKTTPDWEDLLFILNPDENKPLKDMSVAKRMARYAVAPEKITIYHNPLFEN